MVVVWQVIALTERAEVAERNITVEAGAGGNWTHALRELAPGATYQLHAFTLLHDKESAAYASRNFTTSECTHTHNPLIHPYRQTNMR